MKMIQLNEQVENREIIIEENNFCYVGELPSYLFYKIISRNDRKTILQVLLTCKKFYVRCRKIFQNCEDCDYQMKVDYHLRILQFMDLPFEILYYISMYLDERTMLALSCVSTETNFILPKKLVSRVRKKGIIEKIDRIKNEFRESSLTRVGESIRNSVFFDGVSSGLETLSNYTEGPISYLLSFTSFAMQLERDSGIITKKLAAVFNKKIRENILKKEETPVLYIKSCNSCNYNFEDMNFLQCVSCRLVFCLECCNNSVNIPIENDDIHTITVCVECFELINDNLKQENNQVEKSNPENQ